MGFVGRFLSPWGQGWGQVPLLGVWQGAGSPAWEGLGGGRFLNSRGQGRGRFPRSCEQGWGIGSYDGGLGGCLCEEQWWGCAGPAFSHLGLAPSVHGSRLRLRDMGRRGKASAVTSLMLSLQLAKAYSYAHHSMHQSPTCGEQFADGITNGASWYSLSKGKGWGRGYRELKNGPEGTGEVRIWEIWAAEGAVGQIRAGEGMSRVGGGMRRCNGYGEDTGLRAGKTVCGDNG